MIAFQQSKSGCRVGSLKKALAAKVRELQNLVLALNMKEMEIRRVLENASVDLSTNKDWRQLTTMLDYAGGVLAGEALEGRSQLLQELSPTFCMGQRDVDGEGQ